MFCVGLTGRIASGKSTVARLFQSFSVPVISADRINRQLLQTNPAVYQAMIGHFGQACLLRNKHLNKRFLSQRVLGDARDRQWIEALLHPLIQAEIEKTLHTMQGDTAPYCVIEIPLLLDSDAYPYLNRILLVDVEESIQLKRLLKRASQTQETASAWIALQAPRAQYQTIAQDHISNTGSRSDLKRAVKVLHQRYLFLSQSSLNCL